MIYFIQCEDYVKIGYSRTVRGVKGRLAGIQTGNPYDIKLLASITGNAQDEKKLHWIFRDLRERGEWFKNTGVLTECITELIDGVIPDHIAQHVNLRRVRLIDVIAECKKLHDANSRAANKKLGAERQRKQKAGDQRRAKARSKYHNKPDLILEDHEWES